MCYSPYEYYIQNKYKCQAYFMLKLNMRGGYAEEFKAYKSDQRLYSIESADGNGHSPEYDFEI